MNIDSKNPCIEFSADARCDRCGHRAYMCAEKDNLLLTFCGHHGRLLNKPLQQEGWKVVWDTAGLETMVRPEYIPVPV